MSKKKVVKKDREATHPEDTGRRKFILLGAGAIAAAGAGLAGAYRAGWFDRSESGKPPSGRQSGGGNLAPVTLPADYPNALRAVNQMLEHYARELNNPSVLIHAVRGFGKGFKLADGTNAVDYLCSRFAADKEVNGKRYLYFTRAAEVHENSFLKTFLEAGVSQDQPVIAGGVRFTLDDLAESGKALFRCDPKDLFRYDANQYRYDTAYFPPRQTADLRGELVHEHLPWGLIAFSILMPPESSRWTNAYGETIDLAQVADRGLAEYEATCALGRQEMERGEIAPKAFRDEIKKYSCFGLHSVYGFLSCLRHGYRKDNLAERAGQMLDLATYRLKSEAEAINQDYDQQQGYPPFVVEATRSRALVKFYGHAFEAINYAKLHRLTTLTAAQERRIQAGEQALYQTLVKMRALDWGELRKTVDQMMRAPGQGDKFLSDVVIALGHAARAMKLLTPQNPDTIA